MNFHFLMQDKINYTQMEQLKIAHEQFNLKEKPKVILPIHLAESIVGI